jgi:hypothetical protein
MVASFGAASQGHADLKATTICVTGQGLALLVTSTAAQRLRSEMVESLRQLGQVGPGQDRTGQDRTSQSREAASGEGKDIALGGMFIETETPIPFRTSVPVSGLPPDEARPRSCSEQR